MATDTSRWQEAIGTCAAAIEAHAARGYLLDSEVADIRDQFSPPLNSAQILDLVEQCLSRQAAHAAAAEEVIFISEAELAPPSGSQTTAPSPVRPPRTEAAAPAVTVNSSGSDVVRAPAPRSSAVLSRPGMVGPWRGAGATYRNPLVRFGVAALALVLLVLFVVAVIQSSQASTHATPTASPVTSTPAPPTVTVSTPVGAAPTSGTAVSEGHAAVIAAVDNFSSALIKAERTSDCSNMQAVATGLALQSVQDICSLDAGQSAHIEVTDLTPPSFESVTVQPDGLAATAKVQKHQNIIFVPTGCAAQDTCATQNSQTHLDAHYVVTYHLIPQGRSWIVDSFVRSTVT